MIKFSIILAAALLAIGLIGIYCMSKRENSYWDWLANYNLPKKNNTNK